MDLGTLNNFELLRSTERAVEVEKKCTHLVLKHLAEVEKRKAFAELGHSSLYDYCLYKLKYSEQEAFIRLNAMRLMKRDHRIEEKIISRELSLTNAHKIQSFAKKARLQNEQVMELVSESVGKSTRQVEAIIEKAKGPDLGVIYEEKIIRLGATPARKLENVKNLLGEYTDAEVVEILVDQKLREPRKQNGTASKFGRYISKELRDFVFKRARHCCEFEGCSEKRFLQIDHIIPVAKGGENSPENLRVLCAAHNQLARVKSFGHKKDYGFT